MPKPSLIDAVHAQAEVRGPRCTFVPLYERLKADGLAGDLDRLLADATVPTTHIVAGLRQLKYECSAHMLQRHRRGSCGCTR